MYALFQFYLPPVMIITHNHVIITTQGTNMHDISKEFVMMDELVETAHDLECIGRLKCM
jgi:hypothetical protein